MMRYKFQERPTPKYIWLLIIVLVFIAVFGLLLNQQYKPTPVIPTTTTTTTPVLPPITTGNLIIAVKDVPQKVPRLGTVTALELNITKIEVHEAGENETNETTGWTTVFEGAKILDLIQFTDVIAIVGQKELDAGKYTQIRLILSDSSVKIYSLSLNIYNRTYPLKVPSKELKLVHSFEIQVNKTLALTLDFDIEKSLDRTSEGYTLKPTVKILEQTLDKGKKPENSKIIE
jgi:hypothetical protein